MSYNYKVMLVSVLQFPELAMPAKLVTCNSQNYASTLCSGLICFEFVMAVKDWNANKQLAIIPTLL